MELLKLYLFGKLKSDTTKKISLEYQKNSEEFILPYIFGSTLKTFYQGIPDFKKSFLGCTVESYQGTPAFSQTPLIQYLFLSNQKFSTGASTIETLLKGI